MSHLALELNDVGLLALGEHGAVAEPSPGIALIEGEDVIVGRAALSRARLVPRRVHTRFWDLLDTAPLRRPFPARLSTADLAHEHLQAVWREVGHGVDRVVLAVPGVFTEEQLGLLLGIANACAVPVRGLADAAVAASVGRVDGPRVLHLDLTLHRAVLTELVLRDGAVHRGRVESSDAVGQAVFEGRWLKAIAGTFVQRTRFDPLHSASTEQALYDRLPAHLDELARQGVTTISMAASGRVHSVELQRRELVATAAGEYNRLVELASTAGFGPGVPLLLSHRLAALPGLEERIREVGKGDVHALPMAAAPAGALANAAAIVSEDEALPYVLRLPIGDSNMASCAPAAELPRGPDQASGRPTHVLYRGRALPIGPRPFLLGTDAPNGELGLLVAGGTDTGVSRRHCTILLEGESVLVEDHSRLGTFLNGQRIRGQAAVAPGDRLRLGSPGAEVELIRVEGADGPS